MRVGRRDPVKFAAQVEAIVKRALSDDEIRRVVANVPKPELQRVKAYKYARVLKP